MKCDTPNILLVNPWIHDFAAYDFWAKPLGLLTLASILRQHGFLITYIDCLDRFHPKAPQIDPYTRNGRGSFLKTKIPKPKDLEHVPRNFSRYGIMPEWFREELQLIPKPDLILVTSFMTYWYPGVNEAIRVIKETYSDTPLILGGIYAGLCNEHAVSHSGADIVLAGPGEKYILKLAENNTGFSVSPEFDPDDLDTYPYPAFDLQRKISYIPILTSKGCPFSCSYCASHFLNPKRMLRSPLSLIEEIKYWHFKHGVKDFVFYDDALLVNAEAHAVVLFEGLIKENLNVRFHTPNAVHIREISEKTAGLMFRAGFKTLRLGLETTTFEKRKELDSKVTACEFKKAVSCLRKAGFQKNQIGAYLLTGLPGQTISSVEESIREVKRNGITPVLAHYSPVPHTALWDRAVASSHYDLEADPVFTNNAIFPCWFENFSWEKISYLKNLASA
ncbi:MAG: radical SAM protein [Proteobacteria bacterium]|nr:radical SAM protein [Desulfobacteraceae bacterium]MBU2522522.1 radical SAM protein [Pseudomonadota bacterium]MBU3981109.1 radical SAM protein [Pseudomonadota bacterium]MBU4013108.1 radical SAM protein [Pseudomonadota bacterium]MBU4068414.1 radical SAM protein [Pseudomonadota bacterium]